MGDWSEHRDPTVKEAWNALRMIREAILNVDGWPDDYPVPDVGLKLVCSECGGKHIETRPNWRERPGRSIPRTTLAPTTQ